VESPPPAQTYSRRQVFRFREFTDRRLIVFQNHELIAARREYARMVVGVPFLDQLPGDYQSGRVPAVHYHHRWLDSWSVTGRYRLLGLRAGQRGGSGRKSCSHCGQYFVFWRDNLCDNSHSLAARLRDCGNVAIASGDNARGAGGVKISGEVLSATISLLTRRTPT